MRLFIEQQIFGSRVHHLCAGFEMYSVNVCTPSILA